MVCASISPCGRGLDVSKLPPATAGRVDFAKDVRPLFERACVKCHGPEKQKGGLRLDEKATALEGGDDYAPDIIPGNSEASPLIHFIAGLDPEMKMPAKGDPLTTAEVGLLRAWIDQGAPWPDAKETRVNSESRHWSLRPVSRPSVPTGEEAIDFFVRHALAASKLTPSPPADRRTLIRRVFFDVTGLPPTPEEVEGFVADKHADAYEKLVDHLLGSPQYGERWARHWLDVVRFAETNGFETNTPRRNAWLYRDYVIRALNDDKPFDRFVLEQLAGDSFGADEATGFLVAGPWDEVKSPDKVLTAQQRADELHDIVSTVGSAFLGLTIGCARCHDHKFDPIPQTDYYAIKACFAGVQHGERRMGGAAAEAREREAAEPRRHLAEVDAKLAEYGRQVAEIEAVRTCSAPIASLVPVSDPTLLRPAVNARLNVDRFRPVTARRLRFTVERTTDLEPCLDELEVYTPAAPGHNVALASAGTAPRASSVFPDAVRHRIEFVNDGVHGNERSWISNERGAGWVELQFAQPLEIDRVLWGRDRDQKYSDRLALEYRIEVETAPDVWQLVASSRDRSPFRTGQKIAALSSEMLTEEARADVARLQHERAEIAARVAALEAASMGYVGRFVPPPSTFRLHRGDPMQPRDEVAPGGLSAIHLPFEMADGSNEQQRRLALARWIASGENPLTARVIVNRIWQYHFGEGLVSTPSDFGANGAQPTHPELLDWLASELVAHGWSLKHLHRLILRSATYQQASAARPDALAIDGATRLLWRFPPRRLEAEAIRDAILLVSGKLDLTPGGPGFSTFKPNENYVRVYDPLAEFGPVQWRRMIYMTKVRMQQDPVFGIFDCPDGGQITPRRTRSTTPLQALNLLNSRFLFDQAAFLAERLRRDAGQDKPAQIQRAFRLVLSRNATSEEVAAARAFVEADGLLMFARALFNTNEFVYLF